jgi:hypothetical protein
MQLCGAKLTEGIFVGSFLSMSSTAVVIILILLPHCYMYYFGWIKYITILPYYQVSKFLVEKSNTNALHGQVTIGTLILQVCSLKHFLLDTYLMDSIIPPFLSYVVFLIAP